VPDAQLGRWRWRPRPQSGQLVDEAGDALHPVGDHATGHVTVEFRRLGAVLVGVAEHPHRVEAGADEELLELP